MIENNFCFFQRPDQHFNQRLAYFNQQPQPHALPVPISPSNLNENYFQRNQLNQIFRPIPLLQKQLQPSDYPIAHQTPVRIAYSPSNEVSQVRFTNELQGLNVAF